jgi:3-phenylpropionate/cinnamic acid dioxygenase small subunit
MDEASDPEQEPSILYDDALTRAERVHQLLHESHYTQMPPSRTVHFISNVRVDAEGDSRETVVRCNVVAFELRPGDQRQLGLGSQRPVAGRCEYRLRYQDRWRISLKKVVLIDRDLPLENFTFIL